MSQSQLLSLPREIRNQIYYLLLIAPPPHIPHPLGESPPLYPQILTVCHQIHHEAKEILYGYNIFIAHYSLLSSLPQLRRWYDPITSSTLIALIRRYHIYVRLDCDPKFTAETARKAFTGVKELTVEVFQAQFGSSDYQVLRLFEQIRSVKTARVFGSISAFPEYATWLEDSMMSPEVSNVRDFLTTKNKTDLVKASHVYENMTVV